LQLCCENKSSKEHQSPNKTLLKSDNWNQLKMGCSQIPKQGSWNQSDGLPTALAVG
jgi:hypothetical protein